MVRFHSIALFAACLSGADTASLRGEHQQEAQEADRNLAGEGRETARGPWTFDFLPPWGDNSGNEGIFGGFVTTLPPLPDLGEFDFGTNLDNLDNIAIPSIPNITRPDADSVSGMVASVTSGLADAVENGLNGEDLGLQDITLVPRLDPIECRDIDLDAATVAAAVMPKAESLDCFLYYFSNLGSRIPNVLQLQGEYTGGLKWWEGTLETAGVEQSVYRGLSCNDRVCTVINRSLPRYVESGPVSYEPRCSFGLDYYYCLKIDFTAGDDPRYYYVRILDGTTAVAVVQSEGNAGEKEGITSIHTLDYFNEYTEPIDFTIPEFPEGATFPPIPEANPTACASLQITNATLIANLMTKENGLECMLNYYAALGSAQTNRNLEGALQGQYSGFYHWFAGSGPQQVIAQSQWMGMSCDSGTCSFLNWRADVVDIGYVTVESRCPLGVDSYPCIKMDFGGSEDNPRVYFTRMIDTITFVSVTKITDGRGERPAEGVTDVNVITLQPLD